MDPQQLVWILPIVLPLFLVGLWFGITSLLGMISGWYRLAVAFPDRDETPILRLRGQSGRMGGGVNLDHVLTLSVCPSGLRVGMMRMLGPFSRDFLVPWESITLARKTVMFWTLVELTFGDPAVGKLSVKEGTAAKLAEAAGPRWPEDAASPPQVRQEVVSRR